MTDAELGAWIRREAAAAERWHTGGGQRVARPPWLGLGAAQRILQEAAVLDEVVRPGEGPTAAQLAAAVAAVPAHMRGTHYAGAWRAGDFFAVEYLCAPREVADRAPRGPAEAMPATHGRARRASSPSAPLLLPRCGLCGRDVGPGTLPRVAVRGGDAAPVCDVCAAGTP